MHLRATLAAALLALPLAVLAQPGADLTIDAATRHAVVDELIKDLKADYVFPETAAALESKLRDEQRQGHLDQPSAQAFADALTALLRTSAHDKHLGVAFSAEALPVESAQRPTEAELAQREAELAKYAASGNYGIEKVEHLRGNIGYIELRGFLPARTVVDAYAAAMKLVNGSDALIIDLRRNRGGDPEAVALLESYFFARATHVNDIVSRDGTVRQHWTSGTAGPRYDAAKPVYILTSATTFSGGEDLSYSMQAQHRATLVGETTGGGANPGRSHRVGEHFSAFIPYGRAHNPVTGGNWEGSGVQPEVAVPAADALVRAQQLALTSLLQHTSDPDDQRELQAALAKLK
ncbi:MAG: S41 family peptidase [Telluria sp.]